MKKFFVNEMNIEESQIKITGDEFFHFSKVLRTQVGEKVICLANTDYEYHCVVKEITSTFAVVEIEEKSFCNCNPKVEITVFQGLPKGEKLDLIVQKISELGASKIVTFESEFTIAKENPAKMERLKRVAKEACKQCGRSKILEIAPTININDIDQYINEFDLVLFLYENNPYFNNINNIQDKIVASKKIAIIVGTEGGFSSVENNFLSGLKVEKISLGRRILRTETASIATVGYLSFLANS